MPAAAKHQRTLLANTKPNNQKSHANKHSLHSFRNMLNLRQAATTSPSHTRGEATTHKMEKTNTHTLRLVAIQASLVQVSNLIE